MANSPGPSTSHTPDLITATNSPQEPSSSKKRKRTRRRPRNRVKNGVVEHTNSEFLPFTPNFIIQAVRDSLGIVYRIRDAAYAPINIKSFIKNGVIPCVFQTGTSGCEKKIVDNFSNLSINGLPNSKKLNRKIDKKRRRNKIEIFPNYASVEEVEIGLRKGTLMKGLIRINPKNFKESYVGNEDITKADYVISSIMDRNRALEGDEVILRLKTVTEEKKKLMEVVYITQKVHPRTAVGFLEPIEKNNEYALFIPRDKRVPKMKIPKISWPSGFQANPKLYSGILFLAKIQDWREVNYALGTIIENLGLNGDLKVESIAILREMCLDPTPYGDKYREYLPKSNEIPSEEFKYRADLRKECIFTIDPLTARDLDDAVSCKVLPNGNYEVGVHISDASFYLKEKTELDEKVRKKATTIYMVDSVYHMLPTELCLHCSLLPGQDKLAFSVIWELSPEGDIINYKITRSIINSCVQLAYEHAQIMIDEPNRKFTKEELPKIHNGFNANDLSQVVNNLQNIAVSLREKRLQNGSLKIDQIKISFSLDPKTGEPVQFWVYENLPAHRLIEELMLLANRTVAEFINETFPDLAFLRRHDAPKSTMMVDLQKNLETIGMHIDISSSGGIQNSLNKYMTDDALGQARMIVLNHLLAKPMKRAKYFCAGVLEDDDYKHFALSIPIYTHFTSPIRRYADIMVHRLVAASLNYCDKPNWQPEEVANIAELCNLQKYHAKKAGDASCDLYLAHFIEKNQPFIQDAVVVDTKERSIDVIVLSTGSVVRIYTNNFGENVSYKSEEIQVSHSPDEENPKRMWKMFVKFPKTKNEPESCIVLEIFTLVRIELSRKAKTNKLEAKLLRP